MSQSVVAYLIYSTGILIQYKNVRNYHCRWLDESKIVRSKDKLKSIDVHDRAKNVFRLLNQKADVMVIINGSLSFFDVIEMIADSAKEYAKEVKVITTAMAQLMTIPPLFSTFDVIPNALIRVVNIFETKDFKSIFDGEEFILKRVGSNYLLTEHYPDHRIIPQDLADTSHLFDFTVFVGSELILRRCVNQFEEKWPFDQVFPLWNLYNRYDYFHCEGALLKGFEMLTVLPENNIIDFSNGFDAQFENPRTMKYETVELVKYGTTLPVEIYGINEPKYSLFYHSEAIRDHATVKLFAKPCSKQNFGSNKGELLYFIGKDGIPRKLKPDEIEDPFPSSSWTDLSKFESARVSPLSDTSEEAEESKTESNGFPFAEKTRLIICVDLESGYVLLQDFSKHGQQYITRFWNKPTKFTEDVCKKLLEKLPKKYVYKIINLIGSLTEDEMKIAQPLNFLTKKLIWTSKKRAEILYCLGKLGKLYVKSNLLVLVIYRKSSILDIFYIKNGKIIDQEKSDNGQFILKQKADFLIKIYPIEKIGTNHDSGLVFLVDKEFGDPDGTIKESPEELRLFGAYADSRLLMKTCEYTGLEREDLFLPENVEDFDEEIENFVDNGHLVVTLKNNEMKLEVISENYRQLIKNVDDEEWTPTYFYLANDGPIVGQVAKNSLNKFPDRVVFDLLEFMGKKLVNIEINPKWRFELIDDNPGCIVELKSDSGTKRFKPHYILACIINAAIKFAETTLDTTFTVVDVDVKNFDPTQSELIKNAIEITGKKFGRFFY